LSTERRSSRIAIVLVGLWVVFTVTLAGWWLVFGLIASSYSLVLRRTNDPHSDYRGLW